MLLVMKDTVADKPIACRYMLVDGSHRIFLKAAAYGLYVVNQIAYIHSQISQFSVKYFGQYCLFQSVTKGATLIGAE